MYAHAGTETFFHRSKKTSSKFCVGYILYIVVIASRKNDLQEKLCFVQHKKIVAFKSKQRYNKTAINSKHLLQISSILSLNFNKVYDKHLQSNRCFVIWQSRFEMVVRAPKWEPVLT